MPRKTILTEQRLRSDIEVLRENTDKNGVCTDQAPYKVLQEHYGYKGTNPAYKIVRALEQRGRLSPVGTNDYYWGFKVDPLTYEALGKRLEAVKAQIGVESAKLLLDDMEGIVKDLGKLVLTSMPK